MSSFANGKKTNHQEYDLDQIHQCFPSGEVWYYEQMVRDMIVSAGVAGLFGLKRYHTTDAKYQHHVYLLGFNLIATEKEPTIVSENQQHFS